MLLNSKPAIQPAKVIVNSQSPKSAKKVRQKSVENSDFSLSSAESPDDNMSIVSETQVKEMMKMVKIEETIKEPEPPKKEVKVKLTNG